MAVAENTAFFRLIDLVEAPKHKRYPIPELRARSPLRDILLGGLRYVE